MILRSKKQSLSLLRDPRIILYWSGQFLSIVGSNIWGIALPLLAIRETNSSLSVALTLLVSSIPELVLGPWAGALADRYNKRIAIIVLDAIRALLYLIAMFAIMQIRGWLALSLLLSVAFMESLTKMWYVGAKAGVLHAFGNEGYDLQQLNAFDRGVQNAARIFGWVVGGFIVAEFSTVIALFANALSFALAAIASGIARLPAGISTSPRQGESQWKFALEGFYYLKRVSAARVVVIRQAILNLLIPAYAFGLPLLAHEFWRKVEYLGLAFGAFTGGGLLASGIAARKRISRFQDWHLWGAIAGAGGLTAILAGASPKISVVLMGMIGLIVHLVTIIHQTRILEIVEGTYVGRVSVLSAVANRITSSLVILALGVAIAPSEVQQAMLGLGLGIGALSLTVIIKHIVLREDTTSY